MSYMRMLHVTKSSFKTSLQFKEYVCYESLRSSLLQQARWTDCILYMLVIWWQHTIHRQKYMETWTRYLIKHLNVTHVIVKHLIPKHESPLYRLPTRFWNQTIGMFSHSATRASVVLGTMLGDKSAFKFIQTEFGGVKVRALCRETCLCTGDTAMLRQEMAFIKLLS